MLFSLPCTLTLLKHPQTFLWLVLSLGSLTNLQGEEFRPLFNGRDLEGWVYVNTPTDTWRVENEMLICSGKPIGEIRTEKMYQNFELELEWRHMVPGGNAGIFVWADDITARGVPFHRGIEVQVLEHAYGNTRSYTTHGDIFPIHGAKMKPINGRGGDRAFPTEERAKPSPEWNHYRIVCNAGNISLAVNGKEVTRGTNATPSKGYICLESEGGVVHYRNIRIKELPATPIDNAQVAIANRGYRSLYSGLDLRGWKVERGEASQWKVNDWVLDFTSSDSAKSSLLVAESIDSLAGFVVDFRCPQKDSALSIEVPSFAGKIEISAAQNTWMAEQLVAPGNWNRLEASLSGEGDKRVLQLNLNGKTMELQAPSAPSKRFSLEATGSLSLANLYVR